MMRVAGGLMLALAMLVASFLNTPSPAQSPSDTDRTILVMLRAAPGHFRPNTAYGGGYADQTGRAVRSRIARRIARAHDLQLRSEWPMPLLGIDCFVMTIPAGRTPAQVISELAGESIVSWAQPLALFHAQARPAVAPAAAMVPDPRRPGGSDPLAAAQPAERLWRLSALHRIATGRGIAIAVVDSRIDVAHPDLAGQIAVSRDFVGGVSRAPERHGTEVAGVIAARTDNGAGIAGIAPGARLMGLRACWDTDQPGTAQATLCDSLSLAKALQFAIEHHAQIINLSLSGPYDILLARLIALAIADGTTIVAAVDPARHDGGFPAGQPGVIAVTDKPVAGQGASVYAAPGADIPTTGPAGTWLLVNGSSFAAAHVSGLMALARDHARGPVLAPVRWAGGGIDACRTMLCPLAARERPCSMDCPRPLR